MRFSWVSITCILNNPDKYTHLDKTLEYHLSFLLVFLFLSSFQSFFNSAGSMNRKIMCCRLSQNHKTLLSAQISRTIINNKSNKIQAVHHVGQTLNSDWSHSNSKLLLSKEIYISFKNVFFTFSFSMLLSFYIYYLHHRVC